MLQRLQRSAFGRTTAGLDLDELLRFAAPGADHEVTFKALAPDSRPGTPAHERHLVHAERLGRSGRRSRPRAAGGGALIEEGVRAEPFHGETPKNEKSIGGWPGSWGGAGPIV